MISERIMNSANLTTKDNSMTTNLVVKVPDTMMVTKLSTMVNLSMERELVKVTYLLIMKTTSSFTKENGLITDQMEVVKSRLANMES